MTNKLVTIEKLSLGMYAVNWKPNVLTKDGVIGLLHHHSNANANYTICFRKVEGDKITCFSTDLFYCKNLTRLTEIILMNESFDSVVASSLEDAEKIVDIIMKAYEWELLLS